MVLKQIITRNVQNHKEVVIDLPPKGLIVFTGENSNGKSVIVKITRALICDELRKPKKRASLINRNAIFAEVVYVRDDDVKLTAHIEREAAGTYIVYEAPNEQPIRRYLADRNYHDLVMMFGWNYDKESGVTLNIAEADDQLLFYKTSNRVNGSIIQSAVVDTMANTASDNIDTTLSETRQYRDKCQVQFTALQQACAGLKTFDEDAIQVTIEKLQYYLNNLKCIKFPVIPEVKGVPNVSFENLYVPTIPAIKYPKLYHVECNIPDISSTASDIKALLDKKCPMCGRSFVDVSENIICQ